MDDHQLIETLRSEIDRLRIEVEALRLVIQSQPIRYITSPPVYPNYPPTWWQYPWYTTCGQTDTSGYAGSTYIYNSGVTVS